MGVRHTSKSPYKPESSSINLLLNNDTRGHPKLDTQSHILAPKHRKKRFTPSNHSETSTALTFEVNKRLPRRIENPEDLSTKQARIHFITLACLRCTGKTACDGTYPACGCCKKRGFDCIYGPTKKLTKKKWVEMMAAETFVTGSEEIEVSTPLECSEYLSIDALRDSYPALDTPQVSQVYDDNQESNMALFKKQPEDFDETTRTPSEPREETLWICKPRKRKLEENTTRQVPSESPELSDIFYDIGSSPSPMPTPTSCCKPPRKRARSPLPS